MLREQRKSLIQNEPKKEVVINVLGKSFDVKIVRHGTNIDKIDNTLNKFLQAKPWNNQSMYKEIYEKNSSQWDDINDDPYFKGKKVNSVSDITKAIKEKVHTIDVGEHVCLLSGEWWIDPEHGWGINFWDGKYIPQGNKTPKFGYQNKFTYLTNAGDFRED